MSRQETDKPHPTAQTSGDSLKEERVTEIVYSGILPPPEFARQYEEMQPGATDRILRMPEEEQKIRKRDNAWTLFNETLKIFGSISISICLIAGGVYCASIGQPWPGFSFAALGIIGAVLRFFQGKEEKN